MSRLKLFALSFLLTFAVLLAWIYLRRVPSSPKLVRVADRVFVTSQLTPDNLFWVRRRGIRVLVDIRPDGESPDQASSSEIAEAAQRLSLDFHYIPVPHETIPDSAVTALNDVLSSRPTSAVLYCHSGRRAVRTFALAEASRPDGPGADAILDMVRAAGFSADDLRDNLARRIALRSDPPTRQTDEHPAPAR